jgi:hypothetical protein
MPGHTIRAMCSCGFAEESKLTMLSNPVWEDTGRYGEVIGLQLRRSTRATRSRPAPIKTVISTSEADLK